jgi:hypothetical protein
MNDENYSSVPSSVASKEQVSVNFKAIAQVCGCKLIDLTHFLVKLKEAVIATVL